MEMEVALTENGSRFRWRQRMRQNWLPVVLLFAIALLGVASGLPWLRVSLLAALFLVALMAFPLIRERDDHEEVRTSKAPARDPDTNIRAALSAINLPLYLIDGNEDVVFQNAAATATFGQIEAKTHLSARLRSPAILDCVRETIAKGNVNTVEYSERHPSSRVYYVTVAPVLSEAGPRYFILSFMDISEQRRIERMRSDFVANASHELRTPLASLQGFIETLLGPARNDPKATERFLGIMLEQVQRMNRLVDDLLSLSRLELKAHIAPSDKVELAPLLGHVRDALQPLANDLGVEISVMTPQAPVFVTGDRDELIQVFENLIQNACKYGQEGGKVEVLLTADGDGHGAEVSVRDYGPGIAEEHLPRLTERFYRVNVEASRSRKGTGLGLAIVKHILTRHRARLLIKSELGKGSVFTVRF